MPSEPLFDTVAPLDDGGDTSAASNFRPPPNVDVAEASGGAVADTAQGIEEFTAEGGSALAIVYGEHIIAGILIAKKLIAGTPNQLYALVALGDANGNGGGHGEWEGPVAVYYQGEALTSTVTKTVWVEDAIPTGATATAAEDGWNWVNLSPYPYSGSYAHQSLVLSGTHQHYFTGATATLSIATGDWLYCMCYLDPNNPPREIMLQWREGTSFEHRAYWGENLIAFGTDGTNSRRNAGPLPPLGQWVCLGIRASDVGLEGLTLNGMAFVCYDGRATFDQAGKIAFNSAAGYRFHPGLISTGIYDGFQGVDLYLSAGIAYSGTAYIAVRVPDAFADVEDRPDKLRGRYKCRKVNIYDSAGNLIGNQYSTDPAFVSTDRLLGYYEKRYATNLTVGRQKFRERVNWPKLKEWSDQNVATISWDKDGSGTPVNIARFEAHNAFTGDLSLADAFDAICSASGATWQDDGEQFIFLGPGQRDPVHHFHPGNIIGTPRIEPRDLREQPNYFEVEFRDLDDPFLGLASIPPVKREDLIRQHGENKVTRTLPPMRQSQAQRIAEKWARQECDNPVIVGLTGDESSIHVLPGDEVTLSHPIGNWEYHRFLVLAIELASAEEAPDTVDFTLQQIDGPLYSDTAHSPRQEALTP